MGSGAGGIEVAYFAAQLVLIALALRKPRADRFLSVISGLVLVVAAGFRTGGFDYDDYVSMISDVQSSFSQSIAVQLVITKDPLMLVVIDVCSLISDRARLVLVVMAVLAVIPKVLVAQQLIGRATTFVALYSILAAPALEFEAMRAAVALGLLLLFLAYTKKRILTWSFAIAAVSSHVSALPSLLAPWLRRMDQRAIMALLPLAIGLAAFAGSDIMLLFPRYEDYENNVGTLNAFVPPIVSYLAFLVTNGVPREEHESPFAARANAGSAIGIGLGIGLAGPAVTIAFRFMEFGWVFLLVVLLVRIRAETFIKRRISYHAASLMMLAATLVVSDAMRGILALPL